MRINRWLRSDLCALPYARARRLGLELAEEARCCVRPGSVRTRLVLRYAENEGSSIFRGASIGPAENRVCARGEEGQSVTIPIDTKNAWQELHGDLTREQEARA